MEKELFKITEGRDCIALSFMQRKIFLHSEIIPFITLVLGKEKKTNLLPLQKYTVLKDEADKVAISFFSVGGSSAALELTATEQGFTCKISYCISATDSGILPTVYSPTESDKSVAQNTDENHDSLQEFGVIFSLRAEKEEQLWGGGGIGESSIKGKIVRKGAFLLTRKKILIGGQTIVNGSNSVKAECILPALVSSKGYGILFTNGTLCELNTAVDSVSVFTFSSFPNGFVFTVGNTVQSIAKAFFADPSSITDKNSESAKDSCTLFLSDKTAESAKKHNSLTFDFKPVSELNGSVDTFFITPHSVYNSQKGLLSNLYAAFNSGLCAVNPILCGSFAATETREGLLRQLEARALSPLMIIDDRRFFSDKDLLHATAKLIALHNALSPFLSDLSAPWITEIFSIDGSTSFCIGGELLYFPVTQSGSTSNISLPQGSWTDLYEKRVYKGGESYSVITFIGKPPVFFLTGGLHEYLFNSIKI